MENPFLCLSNILESTRKREKLMFELNKLDSNDWSKKKYDRFMECLDNIIAQTEEEIISWGKLREYINNLPGAKYYPWQIEETIKKANESVDEFKRLKEEIESMVRLMKKYIQSLPIGDRILLQFEGCGFDATVLDIEL